jgi:uncharacterized iron-regulated membrane protein
VSQITVDDPIFADYLAYKAAYTGQEVSLIAQATEREKFYETVYALHERFMAGEFSLGYMAHSLSITKPNLYHLLDAMGLKVTNV